ncbi:hypothetical protein BDZ45DRAFT_137597 [Acephala macrosclerotiorum]|nr:hypothetical protein BDZ45DRAFT_137597 [Acephala macrosclerotiorum]
MKKSHGALVLASVLVRGPSNLKVWLEPSHENKVHLEALHGMDRRHLRFSCRCPYLTTVWGSDVQSTKRSLGSDARRVKKSAATCIYNLQSTWIDHNAFRIRHWRPLLHNIATTFCVSQLMNKAETRYKAQTLCNKWLRQITITSQRGQLDQISDIRTPKLIAPHKQTSVHTCI